MRLRLLTVTLLLVLAGCSSDDFPAIGDSTTTVPGVRPSSTAPSVAVRPGTGNVFCEFLRTYNDRFGRFNAGLTDAQQLRTTLNEALAAIKDAESSAPSDIKAALSTMRVGFESLVRAFEQAGFDFTRLRVDTMTSFQTPEFAAASQRMDTYTRQFCI